MIGLLCRLLAHCLVFSGPLPPTPIPPPPAERAAETAVGEPSPLEGTLVDGTPVDRTPIDGTQDDGRAVVATQPIPPAAATAPAATSPAPTYPAPPATPALSAWRRYAVAAPPADGKPTLTFIIDDVGMNAAQSARAVALPPPLTLSWLPYAPHLGEQVAAGTAHGHETMLHMPMEAVGRMFPGPNALRTWLPPDTNLSYLRAALDSVPNAVALNQHEGSVASLSVPLMDEVMAELKGRGMAFVDSLTIPHSVALRRAQAAGLPAVPRDLFIDNDPNPAVIRARITEVEAIARRYGHAIAIGHPRLTTMDVLEQYLPTVPARGFVLWPSSAAIAAQNRLETSATPAPAAVASAPATTSSGIPPPAAVTR
jgi:uncharacterized protein